MGSTRNVLRPASSFTIATSGAVRKNRLVAGANDGTCVEAGAASARVIGVPKWDAASGEDVTVERNQVVKVYYAAAANFGTKLLGAANGEVTPVGAAAAGDGQQIVGVCWETIVAPGLASALVF